MTPLHRAAERGALAPAKALLRCAREAGQLTQVLGALDACGRPALHWACRCGHTDLAMVLHAAAVELGPCCAAGQPAQRGAMEPAATAAVNSLAFENRFGETALHEACRFGRLGAVHWLLDAAGTEAAAARLAAVRSRFGERALDCLVLPQSGAAADTEDRALQRLITRLTVK